AHPPTHPPGAPLTLQTSATDAPDTRDAEAAHLPPAEGDAIRFSNAELRQGTELELTGARPDRYTGELRLRFAGPSSARVQVLVRKPDGEPHGEDYDVVHSGPAGDLVAMTFFMD
ncbi:MAG: hypothetical protein AB7G12_15625, partial [Thermoanaerobaculia bacterium]